MRKKRANSFRNSSKNLLFALLVVAAAFAVYGVANAVLVSHQGLEIVGKVGSSVSADDAARLQGLAAADILAQSGGGGGVLTTWGHVTTGGSYGMYCSCTQAEPIGPGQNAPSCPSGWTQAYEGYGPFVDVISNRPLAIEICSPRKEMLGGMKAANDYIPCGNCVTSRDYNTCRVCVK